jgi:hypothetical protein
VTRWVDGVAILIWNCCAWIIWGAAVVEVVRTPAGRFVRGWRTKVGGLVIILTLSGIVSGLYLPVGAAVVLAGLRRTRSQAVALQSAPERGPQVPRHEGVFQPREEQ